MRLPPTTEELRDDAARPCFSWWSDVTVGALRQKLAAPDLDERAYWLGALLREANSRDVWLFTTPAEVRAMWPRLTHLGRSRAMWAWILGMEAPHAG